MQAIHTFILPATNIKPTRIKAQCAAKSRIYNVQDEWGWADQEQHAYAAERLAQELGWWDGRIWASGCLKDGSYCHVQIPSHVPARHSGYIFVEV